MVDKYLITDLVDVFRQIWFNMSSSYNFKEKNYDLLEKIKNENQINEFMDFISFKLTKVPKDRDKISSWANEFKNDIKNFIKSADIFCATDKEILCRDEIFKNTLEFIKEAINFNREMKLIDIGQAMRNVWIMNIMQMVLEIDVTMTKSIFAYSMLYPYTDNLIDSEEISEEEKIGFNERLEKIIKGEEVKFYNEYEDKVWKLIGLIEEEYPRTENEDIYNALLSIKKGQDKSLFQQGCKIPYEKDILGISIEKGGTSVLADGYLIKGNLNCDEIWFFFGYGFMLQVCDDIQDVKKDRESGHMTILSQISSIYDLDIIACKLMNFINFLLENNKCFDGEKGENLKELIRKNCLLMVFIAIVKNKAYYSDSFISYLNSYIPWRETFIKKMDKKMAKNYNKIVNNLEKQNINLRDLIYNIEL